MKKLLAALFVAGTVATLAPAAQAEEGEAGGLGPCLASYYIGPRAGYQMNDGVQIRTFEIIEIFITPLRLYDGYLAWNGQKWSDIVKEENLTAKE